jgi:multiple sugar transport system permease protein
VTSHVDSAGNTGGLGGAGGLGRSAAAARRRRLNPPLLGRWARLIVLAAVAFLFAYPMVGFFAMSLKHENAIGKVHKGFLGLGGLSFHNVARSWHTLHAFNNDIFVHWIANSLIVAGGGAVIAVVAGLPSGYALARLNFRGRRQLRFITLLTMVMPNTVLVIPLFLEVSAIHAIDKLWAVAVIMGFFPFGVYLSYIHYNTTMPRELVEAARIDGLSEAMIFVRVGLPLAKQATALVIFFSFVANWTNYFLPLVLLPLSNRATVSVGLQQLIGSSPLFDPTTAAGLAVKLYMPQLALATVITTIPVLLMFVFAQRFLVRGQTLGALKG